MPSMCLPQNRPSSVFSGVLCKCSKLIEHFWSNYSNSEFHLIIQGLISATSRNKAGSTSQWDPQHMAGQSAAKAHYKTHDAPAAPRGPAAPGVVGFACAFASLWPAMCRESHML